MPLNPPGLEECNEICYKDPVLKDQQWSAYIDRSPGAASYSEVFYLFNEFLFLFHLCLSLFLQWNFLLILIIIQLIKWSLYVKILLGIILDLFCPDLFNSFIFLYFLCLVIKIFGPPLLYTGMLSCLCVWLWLQGEFVLMVKLFVASCPFFPRGESSIWQGTCKIPFLMVILWIISNRWEWTILMELLSENLCFVVIQKALWQTSVWFFFFFFVLDSEGVDFNCSYSFDNHSLVISDCILDLNKWIT